MFEKIFGKFFKNKQKKVQHPQNLIADKANELTDEEMQQIVGGGWQTVGNIEKQQLSLSLQESKSITKEYDGTADGENGILTGIFKL